MMHYTNFQDYYIINGSDIKIKIIGLISATRDDAKCFVPVPVQIYWYETF